MSRWIYLPLTAYGLRLTQYTIGVAKHLDVCQTIHYGWVSRTFAGGFAMTSSSTPPPIAIDCSMLCPVCGERKHEGHHQSDGDFLLIKELTFQALHSVFSDFGDRLLPAFTRAMTPKAMLVFLEEILPQHLPWIDISSDPFWTERVRYHVRIDSKLSRLRAELRHPRVSS